MRKKTMKVRVKKLVEEAKLPQYATPGAACFDLHAVNGAFFHPGDIVKVHTGLAFEIPEGYVMLLFGRSGHASKGLQLANCVGVIDSDYRGELLAMLRNETNKPFTIEQGERCAQAMIIPTFESTFEEVDQLTSTQRGEGGFGSTGKL